MSKTFTVTELYREVSHPEGTVARIDVRERRVELAYEEVDRIYALPSSCGILQEFGAMSSIIMRRETGKPGILVREDSGTLPVGDINYRDQPSMRPRPVRS